jgi:hypothetical protein
VPASPDRQQQPVVTGEADRRDDVVSVGAPRDQRRPLVDHRVEDCARLLVVGVVRADQPAREARKLASRVVRGCDCGAHRALLCCGPDNSRAQRKRPTAGCHDAV